MHIVRTVFTDIFEEYDYYALQLPCNSKNNYKCN